MITARLPLVALAVAALAAPWTCIAAAPASVAAQNCAQVLAGRLHARLAGVIDQPNLDVAPISTSGVVANQMILTARTPTGFGSGPMVCSYDRQGRVVSLQRPAPVDDMPLIDASSTP